MNKCYLLFLCCFSFTRLAFAQRMIDVDNRWRFYQPGDFSGYGRGFYAVFFKDSIEINGKFYLQAYVTTDSTFQDVSATNEFYREENGMLYQRNERLKSEELLYNFNLNEGDSIVYAVDFFPSRQQVIKVLKVDIIQLHNQDKRKRLTVYNPQYGKRNFRYWIEGIGGTFQTFNPKLMYISDGGSSLSCFFHKDEYTYGEYDDKCPEKLGRIIIDNIREVQPLQGVQLLQSRGDGNISFRLENPGHYHFKVYNTLGSLLKTQAIRQGDHFVDVTKFPKGIYFLQIYDQQAQRQKTYKFLYH